MILVQIVVMNELFDGQMKNDIVEIEKYKFQIVFDSKKIVMMVIQTTMIILVQIIVLYPIILYLVMVV
jgi:hypothetical protein